MRYVFFILLIILSSCSFNKKMVFNGKIAIFTGKYWAVFKENNNIYSISFPLSSQSPYEDRGMHYIIINKDLKNNNLYVSVVGGKPYKETTEVIIKVNYNEYYLPVSSDRAWLTNQNQISLLLNDLKNSKSLTVINTYNENQAIDEYSLEGFSKSLDILNKNGKIKE